MKRWTDIHDDPDGWLEIEIEVRGPRVFAEKLAEGDLEETEPPCECVKCRKIRKRVRVKLRRARRAAAQAGR